MFIEPNVSLSVRSSILYINKDSAHLIRDIFLSRIYFPKYNRILAVSIHCYAFGDRARRLSPVVAKFYLRSRNVCFGIGWGGIYWFT